MSSFDISCQSDEIHISCVVEYMYRPKKGIEHSPTTIVRNDHNSWFVYWNGAFWKMGLDFTPDGVLLQSKL